MEPRIRINYGRSLGFGPGKADLFEHIERTGLLFAHTRLIATGVALRARRGILQFPVY